MVRVTKKLRSDCEKWKHNHGGIEFQLEKENVLFYNGGLFQNMTPEYAELFVGDLDDTIRYLQSLQRFLNKRKIRTGWKDPKSRA